MAISGPSEADRELAARARARGVEVTPRQVERYREGGYLRVSRHGRGRGLGSFAIYEDEALDQLVDITRQLERHGRLRDAALVAFLHGHPIKEHRLRKAYESVYKDLRRYLNPKQLADPWDVASQASKTLSRYASRSPTATEWKHRLKESGSPEALSYVVHDVLLFLLGGAEEGDTLVAEAFEAMGMGEFVKALDDDQRGQLNEYLRALSLSSLEEKARSATYEDLVFARDSLSTIGQLLYGEAQPPPNAEWAFAVVGIPAVLIVGALMGSAFAGWVAMVKEASEQS